MVIMALDHVRDFFHAEAMTADPLDLSTTTRFLFFTRWITHFCAPVFVFLSGTSAYLQSLRKTPAVLGGFLIKRGVWLVVIEVTVITLAITFDPFHKILILQVIWAIGISMIVLGLLILARIKYTVLLIIGAVIVSCHNAFDYIESQPGFQSTFLWDLLHNGRFVQHPITSGLSVIIVYPFLPWAGLMILGFCSGKLFTHEFHAQTRRTTLIRVGLALLLIIVVLRLINVYGDPVPWSGQQNLTYSFLSFITVTKYPPSLLYLCLTIGTALVALAYLEGVSNWLTEKFIVFGRTALFYYIIHFTVIHLASAIAYLSRGHSLADASITHPLFWFVAPGEGYSLWVVYGVWLTIVVALYPLCKWYDEYKRAHRQHWWLGYI